MLWHSTSWKITFLVWFDSLNICENGFEDFGDNEQNQKNQLHPIGLKFLPVNFYGVKPPTGSRISTILLSNVPFWRYGPWNTENVEFFEKTLFYVF